MVKFSNGINSDKVTVEFHNQDDFIMTYSLHFTISVIKRHGPSECCEIILSTQQNDENIQQFDKNSFQFHFVYYWGTFPAADFFVLNSQKVT
jgi:hypothetical protein